MNRDNIGPDAREPTGRFAKGNPGGPGRKRLPEWFRGGGEHALRVIYTAATGLLPPGENPPAAMAFAIVDGVPDTVDPETRLEQANKMADRILGKAPETVEVDVGARDSLLDALLAVAHPRKSEGQNEPNSDSDGEDRGGA